MRHHRSGQAVISNVYGRRWRDWGLRVSQRIPSIRETEYRHALRFLRDCERVLDVGCGTGTFLARRGHGATGIDINPDNVAYCVRNGLDAREGSALAIPFDDDTFDGVHSSHVMQVFGPSEAATFVRELARVVRPGGIVVITTLNWFRRFYRHPENVRPYPPDALHVYGARQHGASSPMFPGMPHFTQEEIWLRRPPLLELWSARSHDLNRVLGLVNRVQYAAGLRKYWLFDSYVIKLKLQKP
jgi:SAM-dependent methyltransferase